jgi:hypothetical protein
MKPLTELISEVLRSSYDVTNDEQISKFFPILYHRVSGENIPSTFLPRYPDERLQLSNDERLAVQQAHDVILQYNYDLDDEWGNYEGESYAEGDIPYYDNSGKFAPSVEKMYNIKFIEELDKINPQLSTKILMTGFAPIEEQTPESQKLVDAIHLDVTEDIKGDVTKI